MLFLTYHFSQPTILEQTHVVFGLIISGGKGENIQFVLRKFAEAVKQFLGENEI